MLTKPSVETIFKKLGGELLSAKTGFNNRVERCMIGDMIPQDVLTSLEPGTLLIIPANREGLIMAALCGNLIDSEVVYYLSGIVFTGNTEPHEKILNLIKRTHIPLLSVKEDSFTIATIITNMLVKVSEKDSEKITKIQNLVEEYVDVDRICEEASSK
jgi:BioD-like phosphotransacetylase family protein